ncbi:putative metallophosphoesterase [Deinococcus radiotolerans]|uniref:Metallophosphoesterase n=1 Tax=Deinococcus radiotolerans TaxID=1309407 RepID=A0ABQ2FM35_9DEIO|nr:putative metallophosphoesterase [Deinococcus radiotolerans]
MTRHARALPGLRAPLSVAFLTDLHYGLYIGAGSVAAWVDATNALQPDVVLLGGDQLDARMDRPEDPLLRELARLQAPLGKYAVWGNHDYGNFGRAGRRYGRRRADWQARREAFAQALAGAGVTVLRNEGRALRDDVWVGGVDDMWFGQPDIPAALAGAGDRATVLVIHNPDLLPDLPGPAGLVVCGHTHGGQVRFPLIGAPVVPSRYGQRFAMGWVKGAYGSPAFVSRGLGMSGVPLRNLCEPEIALLLLSPP